MYLYLHFATRLLYTQHACKLRNRISLLLFRWSKSTIPTSVRVPRPRTVWHWLPSISSPHIHRLRTLLRLRIDSDIDGRIQAVGNSLANEGDLHDGVVAALLAHVEECVGGVEGLRLLVGVVGWRLFDLSEKILLDVELTDVRDCAALDCIVGEELGAVVDDGCSC